MGLIDWLFGSKYDTEAMRATMQAFSRNAEDHKSDNKFFVAQSDGTIIPPDTKEYRREEE